MHRASCLSVALLSAFLMLTPSVRAYARVVAPISAIANSDLAVIGTLSSVQRGTFSAPDSRTGELLVIETLKGSLPSHSLTVPLPDHWGRPCLTAMMGMPSFWALVLVTGAFLAGIVHLWRSRIPYQALIGTLALIIIRWFPVLPLFGQRFIMRIRVENWPGPDALVGPPALWVVRNPGKEDISAQPYPLKVVKGYLDMMDERPEKRPELLHPEAQDAIAKLRQYILAANP